MKPGPQPIPEHQRRKPRALKLNDAETQLVNDAAKAVGELATVWRRDTLLAAARKVLR